MSQHRGFTLTYPNERILETVDDWQQGKHLLLGYGLIIQQRRVTPVRSHYSVSPVPDYLVAPFLHESDRRITRELLMQLIHWGYLAPNDKPVDILGMWRLPYHLSTPEARFLPRHGNHLSCELPGITPTLQNKGWDLDGEFCRYRPGLDEQPEPFPRIRSQGFEPGCCPEGGTALEHLLMWDESAFSMEVVVDNTVVLTRHDICGLKDQWQGLGDLYVELTPKGLDAIGRAPAKSTTRPAVTPDISVPATTFPASCQDDPLSKIPPYDESSGEWVTNTEAAEFTGYPTDTLRDYRKAGRHHSVIRSPDNQCGIDKRGMMWRRPPGESYVDPYYYKKTLKKKKINSRDSR